MTLIRPPVSGCLSELTTLFLRVVPPSVYKSSCPPIGLWTSVCPPTKVASLQNKANFLPTLPL